MSQLDDEIEVTVLRLQGWANQLASRFSAPVYLVGSTLSKGATARDIDVRIILRDVDFEARYGISAAKWGREIWSTWSDASRRVGLDNAKLNAIAVAIFHWNMDVQVGPSFMSIPHANCPRLRLDTLDLAEVTPCAEDTARGVLFAEGEASQ